MAQELNPMALSPAINNNWKLGPSEIDKEDSSESSQTEQDLFKATSQQVCASDLWTTVHQQEIYPYEPCVHPDGTPHSNKALESRGRKCSLLS